MAARGDPAADRGLQRQESRDSPLPSLPPAFDTTSALDLADELAGSIPNRKPGTPGSRRAAKWIASKFELEGFTPSVDHFSARRPRNGQDTALGTWSPSRRAARRRRSCSWPIATTRGSTRARTTTRLAPAAMLELAREYASLGAARGPPRLRRRRTTIIFLSTDGGSYGALGALPLRHHSPYRNRVLAVVDLDASPVRAARRPFSRRSAALATRHARANALSRTPKETGPRAERAPRLSRAAHRPRVPVQPVRAGAARRARAFRR